MENTNQGSTVQTSSRFVLRDEMTQRSGEEGGGGGRLERAVCIYSPSLLPSVMVLVYGLRPQHGENISQTGTSVMPISITQAVEEEYI
jgi:hypothetical protein